MSPATATKMLFKFLLGLLSCAFNVICCYTHVGIYKDNQVINCQMQIPFREIHQAIVSIPWVWHNACTRRKNYWMIGNMSAALFAIGTMNTLLVSKSTPPKPFVTWLNATVHNSMQLDIFTSPADAHQFLTYGQNYQLSADEQ